MHPLLSRSAAGLSGRSMISAQWRLDGTGNINSELLLVVGVVLGRVFLPLVGDRFLLEDRLDRTGGIAGAAYIEPATCHGCGVCAGECPAKAIQLAHYTDPQVAAVVENLFEGRASYHGERPDDTASGGC